MVAERAKVVDAEDVVGVGVSVEHGVDLADALADGLLAEVGRSVDKDHLSTEFEEDGRAGAAVVRVGRVADGAGASDRGNAHRGAAAQHREGSLHRVLLPAAASGFFGARERALVTSTYAMRSS